MTPMNECEVVDPQTPLRQRDLEACDLEAVKKDVNNLVWMWAPPELTLADADGLACKIYEEILSGGKR